MKYTLTCYLVMIASMLYSCTDSSANNAAKKSAQQTAKHGAVDNENLITFKENKVLVAEYSGMNKDNSAGIMTVTEGKVKRGELKLGVIVD